MIVNPPIFDGQITIFVCGIQYFGWFKVQVSSQPCTNRLQLSLAAQPWLRRGVQAEDQFDIKSFILFIHYIQWGSSLKSRSWVSIVFNEWIFQGKSQEK